MLPFFKRARAIEADLEKFFKDIEKSVALFELALKDYIEDRRESFEERRETIASLESECDDLRARIKHVLYTDLLIPDARGDVLGLIENLDNIIDRTEQVTVQFSIEQPIIPPFLKDDFLVLIDTVVKTADHVIDAARMFFRDPARVADLVGKIHFWEHEADQVEQRLKRKAFESDEIDLFSRKVHMRYFAEKISLLADEAEEVAERLEVYAIKRRL